MFRKGPGELAVSITISLKPAEEGNRKHENYEYAEKKRCLVKEMKFSAPFSKGEDGSLSSRSSADDMVPVEGVLGNRLLKSPEQEGRTHQ